MSTVNPIVSLCLYLRKATLVLNVVVSKAPDGHGIPAVQARHIDDPSRSPPHTVNLVSLIII